MTGKRLYLIDATAFCYRAFHAVHGLSTSFGQPTDAIYGFVNMLNKILKEKKPEFMGVCFDVSRETFRQKKFAEYKIQRPPMPEGLSGQISLIKEIIRAYGIAIFEKEGYEADDVIATLAKKAKENGMLTTIVSSDKDTLQLVDEKVEVFDPYKDEGVVYDDKKVLEKFGVAPSRISDIIALSGDDVDNIRGVAGIGEKKAVELLKSFDSLRDLLDNVDKIEQDKLKSAIKDNAERIKLNKELAVLVEDVDLGFDQDKLKIGEPDYRELFRLFKHLEFKSFLKKLPQPQEESEDIITTIYKDLDLRGLIQDNDELILSGTSPDLLTLGVGERLFKLQSPGENLKGILSNPGIKKIGHDLKKIKVSLAKYEITLEGSYFDTMIAAHLVNPAKSEYNLNDLAWDYLGKAIQDKEIEDAKAVALIAKLLPKLEKELKEKSLFELFRGVEMPLSEVLAYMELNGIKLDLQILKSLSAELEKRLIGLIEEIYEISGCQFNINSPKQLRQILFEKLKLPVVKKTKSGPSTDEEVLRKLAGKHKLPGLLLEYRQLTKLKSTYIDALPDLVDRKTGRLHTCFNQTATETGRLSSSNPNLQNIPIKTDLGKTIRKAIISFGDDSYLLSCDYSQIELRILAHLSKDDNLISAFRKDKDIHKATASLIYGAEEKDVTEEMRETAKRVNFGIIYGLTYFGLSRDLGIAQDEAQAFIDAYFLRYPKVKEYIQQAIEETKKDGFVTTMLGRRRYIPEINNKNQAIRQFAERQAVNTPIQGSASDLIKLTMIHIYEEIKKGKLGLKMILQIHDELVFDVPGGELRESIDLIRDKMENALKLDVPIRVDIKKGKNWLEMEPA